MRRGGCVGRSWRGAVVSGHRRRQGHAGSDRVGYRKVDSADTAGRGSGGKK